MVQIGRRSKATARAVAQRVDAMVGTLRAIVVALVALVVSVLILAARTA